MNATLSSSVATVLVALALLVPRPASADGGLGNDEVTLKNGGAIRGTVVSSEPGNNVKILEMGQTQPRTIPWSEVTDVERGKHAAKAPSAAPGPPPPPMGEPPPAPGRGPRVHIQTDHPNVTMHQITAQMSVVGYGGSAYGMATRPVCSAPCDRVIDGSQGQEFFFAGDGVPASGRFQLADRSGDVTAKVDAGSNGLRGGGYAMIVVGATGIATGAVLLMTGALIGGVPTSCSGRSCVATDTSGLTIGGGIGLGAGAAVLAGGIIMTVAGRTTYKLVQGGATTSKRETVRPVLTASGPAIVF